MGGMTAKQKVYGVAKNWGWGWKICFGDQVPKNVKV